MAKQKLTSVKIDEKLWNEFKINTIRYKFSFQKLAERAAFLYNTDEEFRKKMHNVKVILTDAE
jgi:hypothetical protein